MPPKSLKAPKTPTNPKECYLKQIENLKQFIASQIAIPPPPESVQQLVQMRLDMKTKITDFINAVYQLLHNLDLDLEAILDIPIV